MAGSCRLLIIGIDGADYAALRRWTTAGYLPHLGTLTANGQLLLCHSTRPALSAPAWTTAFTGCNPGKHGLYDFHDFSYPTRRPWWSLPRGCPSLFRRLSDAGLSCGAINVPMMFPAEEVNGAMISGFGSPGLPPEAFHPRSLRDELLKAIPDYRLQPELGTGRWPDADTLARYAQLQARAAEYVTGKQPLDVWAVVFNSLDWSGHAYWCEEPDDRSVSLEVARAIDDRVGEITAGAGWPTTPVLLLSDHGMRCARRQVNLQKLFVELELTAVSWDRETSAKGRAAASILIGAWNAAKRVLPGRVISWLRQRGHKQREAVLEGPPQMAIDWERTIAAPVGSYGCVRLNVEARDPQGIVPEGDYVPVRQGVADRLREVRDPDTNEPLFAEVLSRDDLYHGPLTDGAPDLVLREGSADLAFGGATSEAELLLFIRQPGLVTALVPPCGVHGDEGVLILSGDMVSAQSPAGECTLADVAPTALHLLGLPVPSYMDGRVLIEYLSGDAAQRTVEAVDEPLPAPEARDVSTTREDEEALTERLRALGYL